MKLPNPRAVLFDLDGTLIDSRLDIAAACNHARVHAGLEPLPVELVATYVGDGARELLARAFRIDAESPEIDALLEVFLAYYAAHPLDHGTWMPGAREALSAVGSRKLGVVTNKSRVATLPVLEALGIAHRVDVVYAGGDGPKKPHPEPVLRAARSLGMEPSDVWLVGDGTQDIGAGLAAGCTTVAVLGGFHSAERLRGYAPHAVLASLEELPALLENSL